MNIMSILLATVTAIATIPHAPAQSLVPVGSAPAEKTARASTEVPATSKTAGLMPSGWYFPTGSPTFDTGGFCRFLCYNPDFSGYHLAQDITNPAGAPVYAIGDGEVVRSSTSVGSYGPGGTRGGAVVVRHRAADGTEFLALYGHINNPHPLGPVCAGEVLGTSNGWDPPHVHFGIHPGPDVPSNPYRGYTRNQNRTYGWVDPIPFLNAHPRAAGGSSVGFRPSGQTPQHPDGALLRSGNDPTVYLIESGRRRGIVSEQILASLYGNGGFTADDVILVSGDEMAAYGYGSVVSSQLASNGRSEPAGRLIKAPGGAEISVVTASGNRRPFDSASVFTGLGYSFCRVREVPDYWAYGVGPIVTGIENGGGGGPAPGSLESGVPASGSVARDEWRHYSIDVPAGARSLVVTLAGSGDPDLYTLRGSRPTFDVWDCRPYIGGADEQCRFEYPVAGTWYVAVHGFSDYSTYTVTATIDGSPSTGWRTVLDEGAEYGAAGWLTSSNIDGNRWVIQAAEPHSGTYRFSSGNGVNAVDNMDQSLWSPTIDLAGTAEARLTYFVTYDTEQNYDWFIVEASADGGQSFTELSRVSGMSAGSSAADHVWAPEMSLDLGPVRGSSQVVLRFRLTTDASVRSWGVVLDDIRVQAR